MGVSYEQGTPVCNPDKPGYSQHAHRLAPRNHARVQGWLATKDKHRRRVLQEGASPRNIRTTIHCRGNESPSFPVIPVHVCVGECRGQVFIFTGTSPTPPKRTRNRIPAAPSPEALPKSLDSLRMSLWRIGVGVLHFSATYRKAQSIIWR